MIDLHAIAGTKLFSRHRRISDLAHCAKVSFTKDSELPGIRGIHVRIKRDPPAP